MSLIIIINSDNKLFVTNSEVVKHKHIIIIITGITAPSGQKAPTAQFTKTLIYISKLVSCAEHSASEFSSQVT